MATADCEGCGKQMDVGETSVSDEYEFFCPPCFQEKLDEWIATHDPDHGGSDDE